MKDLSKVRIFTSEYKDKISASLKKKGIKPPSRKGIKWTKEHREKAMKSFLKTDMSYWKIGKTPKRSKKWKENVIKAVLKTRKKLAEGGKLTNLEKIIDIYLHNTNIEHEHEFVLGKRSFDFYLPLQNLLLEADSIYWHTEKNDKKKELDLELLGGRLKLLRLREKELKNGSWLNKFLNFSSFERKVV